jgi:hypothetical protein
MVPPGKCNLGKLPRHCRWRTGISPDDLMLVVQGISWFFGGSKVVDDENNYSPQLASRYRH